MVLLGANLTHRQWVPILNQGRLTFAYRVGIDAQTGAIPFFHQHVLGGSQWVDVGGNLAFSEAFPTAATEATSPLTGTLK